MHLDTEAPPTTQYTLNRMRSESLTDWLTCSILSPESSGFTPARGPAQRVRLVFRIAFAFPPISGVRARAEFNIDSSEVLVSHLSLMLFPFARDWASASAAKLEN